LNRIPACSSLILASVEKKKVVMEKAAGFDEFDSQEL